MKQSQRAQEIPEHRSFCSDEGIFDITLENIEVQDPRFSGRFPELCRWTRCRGWQPIRPSRHTPLLLSTTRVMSFLFRDEHLSTESPGDRECQGACHFRTILAKHAERQCHQEKTSTGGNPTAQEFFHVPDKRGRPGNATEAVGVQQQSEHCRADAWDVAAPRLLLCLFSARGLCLTGAGRPPWKVNPASENQQCERRLTERCGCHSDAIQRLG